MEPMEEVELLTNSPNRLRILRQVPANESVEIRDLDEAVDATRRTVSRTLSDLEEAGYVIKEPVGYRLAAKGAYLVDRIGDLAEDVEQIAEVEPVLANLPASMFDLDPGHLADAEVLVAPDRSPYAILDRALELRREASRIRELAPGVEGKSITQLADRLRSGEDVVGEIIVPEAAMETAETHQDYRDDHLVNAEAHGIDFYVQSDPEELYLGILDETVALAPTEDGRPIAMAVTESAPVREWAVGLFESVRRDATLIEAG